VTDRDRAILLRYHEVALKGDNRKWFEDRLAMNSKKALKAALGSTSPIQVTRPYGRILLETEWNPASQDALKRVFGISSFSPMRKVPTRLDLLTAAALEEFAKLAQVGLPKTFRVKTRRSDKVLPETSVEIDRIVGSAIKDTYPQLVVDLKNADFTLELEVRLNESFISSEKISGEGGLPVGSNGRLLTLISGGLDSPVAALSVLKRGSPTSFVHFYGAPFVGEEVLEKIEDLVKLVNRYQPENEPLYVVPFGKIQERIALATAPKMRTILYRRMMIRIASKLAQRAKALALVTGESLGQVASQTLENMSSINEVASIPILRPLITFNKDEIIAQAKRWGTYETSIRPSIDCCTLFADRHPTLRANAASIQEQEARLNIAEWVEEAASTTYVL